MNKKRYYILLLAVLLFGSCEKVIDFDPGEVSPYVVMVSRPECDSLVKVYLSRSSFFLEDYGSISYISDASVRLYVGDQAYDGTYVFDSYKGYYQFNVSPQPGDSLYVEATVPGEEKKTTAGTRIPKKPVVELVDYTLEVDEETWSPTFKLSFKIKSGGGREYYSISLINSYEMIDIDSVTRIWDTVDAIYDMVYFLVDDAIVNNTDIGTVIDGDDGAFAGFELNVSNEMFKDGEHVFTLEIGDYSYGNTIEELAEKPCWLCVRSLSPDLYRYNQTIEAQNNSDELFAEPVQVHSNVNGGIGIFGGSAKKVMRMPVARIKD